MNTNNIGQRVLTIRKRKKLTQKEFAKLTGITRSYLAAVETNRKEPSFNFLMSIINTIDVDANWLLKGKDIKKQPEIAQIPRWLTNWWRQANDEHRIWLKIQLAN